MADGRKDWARHLVVNVFKKSCRINYPETRKNTLTCVYAQENEQDR